MADLAFDVLYPRAIVELVIVFDGDIEQVASPTGVGPPRAIPAATRTQVIPSKVTVTRNAHHTASTCEVEIGLSALTFGQRVINSIFLSAFLGLAKGPYDSIVARDNIRFCGYVDVMRDRRSESGPVVSLKCRDLSAIFRDQKPLVTRLMSDGTKLDPTPRYNDTVLSAISRIMTWSGVDDSVMQVSDPYGLGSTTLGATVENRARTGMLPTNTAASAWEAIEHIAAIANLLVSVDLGNIVLSPPSDLFGQTNGKKDPIAYDFVFGLDNGNVLEVEREKKFIRNRQGVKIVVFDPAAKRSVSVVWPPDNEVPPKRRPQPKHAKHADAKAHGSATATPKQKPEADRDIYTFSRDGVTSKDQALAIAKRIYSERSNQELEGTITTKNWTPELLALKNSNRINLTVAQRLEAELRNYDSVQRKLEFLSKQLGMSEDAAAVLLRQTSKEQTATPYYLRSNALEWDTNGASAHIDFINLMLFS